MVQSVINVQTLNCDAGGALFRVWTGLSGYGLTKRSDLIHDFGKGMGKPDIRRNGFAVMAREITREQYGYIRQSVVQVEQEFFRIEMSRYRREMGKQKIGAL